MSRFAGRRRAMTRQRGRNPDEILVILSVAVHCTQVARNVVMVLLRCTLVYKPWRNALASSSRLGRPSGDPTLRGAEPWTEGSVRAAGPAGADAGELETSR
jgi:hypothetical protein